MEKWFGADHESSLSNICKKSVYPVVTCKVILPSRRTLQRAAETIKLRKYELSEINQRTELGGSRVGGSRKEIEVEKKNVIYIMTGS